MKKLISAFAPTVPVWSVFANNEGESIFTKPVEAIAMVMNDDDPFGPYLEYQSGGYDGILDSDELSENHLGYAYEGNPKVSDWKRELTYYKSKMAKKMGTKE